MSSTPASWLEELLYGLAELLADAGVGVWRPDGPAYTAGEVGILLEDLLEDPDELVVLNSYDLDRAAFGIPAEVPVDAVAIQIRTRTAPGIAGSRRLDDAVYDLLEGAERLDLGNGVVLCNVYRNSAGPLGRDAQDRRERVSNFYALVERPTAHRPQ